MPRSRFSRQRRRCTTPSPRYHGEKVAEGRMRGSSASELPSAESVNTLKAGLPLTLPSPRSTRARERMRGFAIFLFAVLFAAFGINSRVQAQLEAQAVRKAIEKGVEYLRREQRVDGSWPEWLGNEGGVTALCTLALLNSGVPPEDPTIQKSLEYLRRLPPKTTYATALQTMALCEAQPKRDAILIRRNAQWFERTQIKSGENGGAWSYPGSNGDNSNTQFALLALHEAERAGAEVTPGVWQKALHYWHKTQNADGSWGYQTGNGGTGSMTCAGIASVVIASGQLHPSDATVVDGKLQCCGDQKRDNSIERALDWLGKNFSVHVNPQRGDSWLFYYLYGVERAGRMTAQRFLGGHDWYREGTDMFVRRQDEISGYWIGVGHAENNPQIGTSLALLFLSKGRRPVLMGKLTHGPDDDWQQHRSDVANLTSYVETRWHRPLTWQVVDSKAASVDDLLQAPVIFFNGSVAPEFSDDQVRRLREYINQGGFIFADACCEGNGFDQGFRELMKRVFPEPEHELRLLPPDHPVWHAEEPVSANELRQLWGIDVGCRTSVIYCPQDISCLWELARPARGVKLTDDIRAQVVAANSIGINVLAYATNRELKFKYEMPQNQVVAAPSDTVERAKLYIGTLKHPGGWDAAPRALVNLQELLSREKGLRISTDRREVTIADETLFDYPLVFMHGRNSFRLSDSERQQLKKFVERGGMILADSVCASAAFTDSFRNEMAAIFPMRALERIPVSDPMLTEKYGGFDLHLVNRRDPTAPAAGGGRMDAAVHQVEPELEGLKIGERYAVIFSKYDLSCALERHESLACQGYTREDAARIAINAVLYGLQE